MSESVERFVERALYEPFTGFYESGGRAGRRGASFITSPEVGPLFGAVIARALDTWWHDAGEPDDFVVVDAGAGPGTLARTVLAAQPECRGALRLVLVERTETQRRAHPEGVESVDTLPEVAHVIIANELLDNLPFGMLEETSEGWVPVRVAPDGVTTPDSGGRRVPVAAAAAGWIGDARRRLEPGGRLICIDYAEGTADLGRRPWTTWVRAFRGQEQVDHPFRDPGSRDITVVIPWDQLPVPQVCLDQAAWLRLHGIDELVEEGKAHWRAHAAAPDLLALRMRSRISEAEALTDPEGLGGFRVGEWQS